MAGALADMVAGSTVAHDGTERQRIDWTDARRSAEPPRERMPERSMSANQGEVEPCG
jgi:hypothetical protein